MVLSKSLKVLISAVVAAALVAGCSKKSDESDEESVVAGGGSGGSGSSSTGALASAVPASLALAVFPQAVDGAALALQDIDGEDRKCCRMPEHRRIQAP